MQRNYYRLIFLVLSCVSSLIAEEPYTAKDFSSLIGMKGFNNTLIEMHLKLYQGYVKNANALFQKIQQVDPNSYEYGALKRRFGWEYDGMRLHELYFENLGGNGQIDPKSVLYLALQKQYGSFEAWKKDFIATGQIRGIGWALLYFDPILNRLINVWINEHDTGHLVQNRPILIMDVFEHAFMPQFGLDRGQYIETFFNNINWDVAAQRFQKVK